jgi:hypothetical protein
MKLSRILFVGAALASLAQPALAGTVNLASPTGTVQTSGNGTNLVPLAVLCGSASTTVSTNNCANTVQVNTSGQLVVNVANTNSNGQTTMANSSPVVLPSDQSALPTKAAANTFVNGWSPDIGNASSVSPWTGTGVPSMLSLLWGIYNQGGGGDPCSNGTKTNVRISSASGTFAVVTGVSAKKIYVCSLALVAPSAVSVSLAEGSSSTCGTSNQAGVIGAATNESSSNGMAIAANGGLTLGTGTGTVAATATAANYLCVYQSGTAQLAGNLTYVQQ